MADIFISYAREDRSRIEPLAKALEGLGWSVFWDRTIPAGKTWRQVLGDALKNARSVIVAWSQKSIESDWVQEEAERGSKRNILIPILIDNVEPPLGFGTIQAADLVKWDPAQSSPEFEKLIADLSTILGLPPKGAEETEQVAEEKRKATIGEGEPSEPETGTTGPRRKGPVSKIGVLIALAMVIVAGAIMLFWQELTQVIGISPPKRFTNSIGMEFVLIPKGSFTMGSNAGNDDEQPPHNVKISQSFYLQTTEVSQGQWKKVMGDNPSRFSKCGDDCPVEMVTWKDAQRFIEKLKDLEKTKAYRLPSEAEWEYACRAGTTTEYSFGDDATKLGEYARYSGNSERSTHRASTRKPNTWGLYDMHGNVWEWVEDDWHSSYKSAPADGRTWTDGTPGSDRLIRGGCWINDARYCRSAMRYRCGAGDSNDGVGFRLARSVGRGP